MPSLLSNGLRILDPADIPPRKQEAVRLARLAVPAPNLLYPFTGTGFTAYVGGRLVPELSLDSPTRLPLPVGTQLVEIDESGQRILRATLGPEGTWLLEKVTLRATRTGAWLSPRFSQRAA